MQNQTNSHENDLIDIQQESKATEANISNQELHFKNTSIRHQEKINEMSEEFEELSDKIKSIQKDVKSEEVNHSHACAKLDKEKKEKSLELKVATSLVDKKEDEYIVWERKIENIEKSVESEQSRISRIKKNFEQWKINSLEEVARMKLKNKMQKIDKAGLTEILNG